MSNLFENLQIMKENKNIYYYKIHGANNYIIAKSSINLSFLDDRSVDHIISTLLQYTDTTKNDIYIIGKFKSISETNEEEYNDYIDNRFFKLVSDKDEENENIDYNLIVNEFITYFNEHYGYNINVISMPEALDNRYRVTGVRSLNDFQRSIENFNNETNHEMLIVNIHDSYEVVILN